MKPPPPPHRRQPPVGMWPARRRARRALWPQALELALILAFIIGGYHGVLWYWQLTSPKEVVIPKVLGLQENEAVRVLTTAGLRPEVTMRKASEQAGSGEVLSAEPPPGRSVKVSRKIRLIVSSGSQWSRVPDVREMAVDRARAIIAQKNLEVGKQRARYHDSVPLGYVISQDPRPEARILRGSEVELVVSKGPTPETEPVDEEPPTGARSTKVEYTIQPGPSLQEVRIVVADSKGEQTVFRDFRKPGETVSETVKGEGANAVVLIYVSGVLVEERPF